MWGTHEYHGLVRGSFSAIRHECIERARRWLTIAPTFYPVHQYTRSSMAQGSSWKDLAEKKRNAIFNSIPTKWHIEKSTLPSNEQQRDVTGYIQQFLSKRELEITETDVVGIAKETSSGNWTAVEVAEAFCHRASLAHQLVSDGYLPFTTLISYSPCRCKYLIMQYRVELLASNLFSTVASRHFRSWKLTVYFQDKLPPRNIFRCCLLRCKSP
jgi:hypothetical protein